MPTQFASARSEYFPSDSEPNSNSNGHGKIFSLKPAVDPDTLAILDARRNALQEPNQRLNRGAKAFFCQVVDLTLDSRFYDSKGVATISDSYIAKIFQVSRRTIYSWKRSLESAGYIWTSDTWKPNMWPITCYHLTCLHKKRDQQKPEKDGSYGGIKFKAKPINPGNGARRPGQPGLAPLPGSKSPPPETENADLQGISPENRTELPLTAEASFGSQPKPTSADSRSQLRATAEASFGSQPKPTSADSRSQLRATGEADFHQIESQIRDLRPEERGGEPTPPNSALEKWIKGLDQVFPSELRKMEAQFSHKLAQAKSQAARDQFRRRIAAIRSVLYGPPVNDAPEPQAAAPSVVDAIASRPPTPEEIEASREFLAERAKRKAKA